jgi:hypothetical protein
MGALMCMTKVVKDDTARQSAAPHCGLHKCFNQALQLGDFRHLPYSPDLAPIEYHFFTKIKVCLPTQRFHTNKELMDGVNNWLHNLAAPFFNNGLQKLVSQYKKCLNVDGNYVEK